MGSGRSGKPTVAPTRKEGIIFKLQSSWEGTPIPPAGSQKLGSEPAQTPGEAPQDLPGAKSHGLMDH